MKLKPRIKKENPLRNKTNWTAFVGAALMFVPVIGPWLVANPEAYAVLMGVAVTIARSFKLLDD